MPRPWPGHASHVLWHCSNCVQLERRAKQCKPQLSVRAQTLKFTEGLLFDWGLKGGNYASGPVLYLMGYFAVERAGVRTTFQIEQHA